MVFGPAHPSRIYGQDGGTAKMKCGQDECTLKEHSINLYSTLTLARLE
jgi:hypothetical protein